MTHYIYGQMVLWLNSCWKFRLIINQYKLTTSLFSEFPSEISPRAENTFHLQLSAWFNQSTCHFIENSISHRIQRILITTISYPLYSLSIAVILSNKPTFQSQLILLNSINLPFTKQLVKRQSTNNPILLQRLIRTVWRSTYINTHA